MARPKQITQNETIKINPKSKNAAYQFTADATLTINTLFETDSGKAIYGYEERYNNFATRKNDDLIVTTLFTKTNGGVKKVTTTVKDYFTDTEADYKVNFMNYWDYDSSFNPTLPWLTTITPDTQEGVSGLFKSGTDFDANTQFLTGTTGADTYDFDNGMAINDYVYDVKGNDTYKTDGTSPHHYIWDMAGNDDYTLDNGGKMYVSDYGGKKDVYTAEYTGGGETTSRLLVEDYAGGDEYNMNEGSNFLLADYKGNDTYTLKDVTKTPTEDVYVNAIIDKKGNDTYDFDNAEVRVNDYAGKDTYTIKESKIVDISDEGKGNDTYYINDCTDLEYGKFTIGNSYGNETYNLTNVKYDDESYAAPGNQETIGDDTGNDKYNLTNVENIIISDSNGKDKYTVTDMVYAKITDKGGNDTYGFTVDKVGVVDVELVDYKGKDSYTFTGLSTNNNYADNIDIDDRDVKSKDKYSFTYTSYFHVNDEGGNDTYKMTTSSGEIEDAGGNDTYNIDTMMAGYMVGIYDAGGNKDKLTLTNMDKDDLIFMTDVRKDGSYDENNSLLIYNKSNDSFVYITDFFATGTDGDYNGFGDGRIETVKIGRTTVREVNKADMYTFFNEIKSDVAAWMGDTYGSVYSILSGTDQDAKDAMVAYFTGEEPALLT